MLRRFSLLILLATTLSCASTAGPAGLPTKVQDLPFRDLGTLGQLWVAPDARIAGRSFEIVEWLPPILETPVLGDHTPQDRIRAGQLSEALPGLMRERLTFEAGAEIHLKGRVFDSHPGRQFEANLAGMTWAWCAFDLYWVEAGSGRTLAVLRYRQNSGQQEREASLAQQLAEIGDWIEDELAPALRDPSKSLFSVSP
jgi:hypothetical protein